MKKPDRNTYIKIYGEWGKQKKKLKLEKKHPKTRPKIWKHEKNKMKERENMKKKNWKNWMKNGKNLIDCHISKNLKTKTWDPPISNTGFEPAKVSSLIF